MNKIDVYLEAMIEKGASEFPAGDGKVCRGGA